MSADTEKIKERLGIVEVVGSYVKLNKAGRTFKGKSPFTNERTPSFFVSPEKNLFHCFSSGKGGDIFTFIQEVEGVDFQTALKMLADRAGITLTKTDPKQQSERTKLYEVLDHAAKLYEIAFRKDPEAVQYLLDRGMTKETMKHFRIGYAPAGWSYLYDQLHRKGFSDSVIEKAGLCVRGDKGLYDRFRERIMFPIMDGQGRVVAFSGRMFLKDDSKTDPKSSGKYVNSPETPVYHKSNILYGYDKAKRAMMSEDLCVLVEGQMDLVMSHQAGVANAVALSGTALTDEQVDLIQRFTDVLVIALDADPAGIAAAGRSVKIAYAHDMDVSIVALDPGQDPADIVKNDPALWQKKVTESVGYIDFRLETLKSSGESTRGSTKIIRAEIYPFVFSMKGKIEQDEALKKIAHFLGSPADTIRTDFSSWSAEHGGDEVLSRGAGSDGKTSQKPLASFEDLLFGIFLWQEDESKTPIPVDEHKKRYEMIVGESWFEKAWQRAKANKNSLIFQAQLRYDTKTPEELVRETESLLTTALVRTLEKKQKNLMETIRQCEVSGDEKRSLELLAEYQALAKKIETITHQSLQ